jgi:hypothetical protein
MAQRTTHSAYEMIIADEGGKTDLVELRAYVRKGGKLKFELEGKVFWLLFLSHSLKAGMFL